jgi:hypothetical protein
MVSTGRRPRKITTASLVLSLATASTGCVDLYHARLTGNVVVPETCQIPDPQQLVSAVRDAIAPSGFVGGKTAVDDAFGFSLGIGQLLARERVDIFVVPKALWISVKDYNGYGESPTARKYADLIVQTLSTRLGVTVNFRPVADCLS